MATWIKVEITTPQKPEIAQIARLCSCSKPEAFMAFFRFYAWADDTTETGIIPFLTHADADEHSRLQGFGQALQSVGWATFDDAGVTIHNWDRHNGESAKKRHLNKERQRRFKAANPNYKHSR